VVIVMLWVADCCITFNSEASKKPNNSETGEADKTVQKQKVSSSYLFPGYFVN